MADFKGPKFPFAREVGYHPPSMNATLRHECPVSPIELYDGSQAWLLMKHSDCCEALASEKLSADRGAPGFPEIHEGGLRARFAKPTFVNLDNPEHDQQRALLEPDFTAETVEEKWRPIMERTVDALIDKMLEKGKAGEVIDLVEDFAVPVPTQIIYQVLGVPATDFEALSRDSEVRNSTSRDAAESANTRLQEYIHELVRMKLAHPGDDVISRLLVHLRDARLTVDEVTTLAFLVLTAGNAALISSISVGSLILLEHPAQLEDFKKQPELVGNVVTEILRYHTASALNSRRAVRAEVQIGGHLFSPGEGLICCVQSADRDEDKFGDNAESFDIHRKTAFEDLLGFGYGPHRCQADKFSRTQLEIVFTKLFKRIPNLRLACDVAELSHTPATMNAGLVRLPVFLS